ncbi:MAG: hypothetical protein JWM11_5241 [Planctomycetaceae bacterium]|nr:hypothetical protein [Planctomycetaceae bacterium]
MSDAVRCHREQALRRAVLAGDETAWRSWYDETFEAVRRFVLCRVRSYPDRCDEVLQETWLVAVKRIRDFDPRRGAFVDWVRGIAANVLKNHFRKWHASHTKPLTEDVAQPGGGPSGDSRSERITEVLQFLPNRYAAVLREKYLEQRSVAEIALAWNETTKTVESLLTRAREAFREAFGME